MDEITVKQRRLYPTVAAFYALHFPMMVQCAREHGYALAVHGSMATDLDLIAVPWTTSASDAAIFVESLRELLGGTIPNDPEASSFNLLLHNPNAKLHGRLAWSIYLGEPFQGPYIDLSVMPKTEVQI